MIARGDMPGWMLIFLVPLMTGITILLWLLLISFWREFKKPGGLFG